jgi:carbamoyl-phosphate synthase large subunit
MNILLTSSGRRSYLARYFQKVIGESGAIHAVNSEGMVSSSLDADSFSVAPRVFDQNYFDFIMQYCSKNQIDLIIPLIDLDALVLSRSFSSISGGKTSLLSSAPEVHELVLDKYETNIFLSENGFDTIKIFVDYNSALDALDKKEVAFPLIVKPRMGWGSNFMKVVHSKSELHHALELGKIEIRRQYGQFASLGKGIEKLVIQEYVSGKEFALSTLSDLAKRPIATSVVEKVRMRAGETEVGRVIHDEQMEELGQKVVLLFGIQGPADIDIIRTESRSFILDINPRFGGSYPFAHESGMNFVETIVDWSLRESRKISCSHNLCGTVIYKDICLRA